MAIITSPSVKLAYVYQLVSTKLFSSVGSAITLYSGSRPTPSEYVANFSSTYSSAKPTFLWHGTGLTTWSVTDSAILMTIPPTATPVANSGVASWAVLWPISISKSSMASLPSSATSTSSITAGFTIVDVSTIAAGTGVVQLVDTTLSTTSTAFMIDYAGFSIS